jgi:toxin ParE1/3/4
MKYLLHPEFERHLQEAAVYYNARAAIALSQALFTESEHTLAPPLLGALWRQGKRRFVMKHIPYTVTYAVVGDEIQVMAVAHHSRRPNYWQKRTW